MKFLTETSSGSLQKIGLRLTVLLFIVLANLEIFAQGKPTPLEWTLAESPNVQLKFAASAQTWLRYTQWNPGSTVENGDLSSYSIDMSLRRYRIGTSWKVGERFKFYALIGQNNYNNMSEGWPDPEFLDLYGSFKVVDQLHIAMGKSTWDGLSRYTAPSTTEMLALDLPLMAQPTLNRTDDITRNLGCFLFGDLQRFNYRIGVIIPYDHTHTGAAVPKLVEGTADFSYDDLQLQYTGYVKYDFLEQESVLGPNFKGTYLGKKHILALGAGAKFQQEAMASLKNGIIHYHDLNLWSVDLFYEEPVSLSFAKALTGYVAYYNYDMGPDYLRMLGVNNPAFGSLGDIVEINGKGNGFPAVGTGSAVYYQTGFMLGNKESKRLWDNLQLYTAGQWGQYEALDEAAFCYRFGLNWYVDGQRMKFTLDGQNRPVFSEVDGNTFQSDNKWMAVMQFQYLLN
ncbi:hypothetical protein [Mangrovimonas sp. DI 80]|uniref:hypothetical protein n=1 Tax=Mangrovimonas sp. DI 80 TaxID=1779330 RepID=UPI000975F0B1|nr:hypothetical protein [Mangrovimonas sp. DI 80]OMP30375.1 hypothetical protein BKM32_13415 [Mangrovimonas sp. DI 80]